MTPGGGDIETGIAIVGGGPIGLACARLFAADGSAVTVFDPGEADAAWRVSAGMLTPAVEADYGETAWLELARQALADYPKNVESLERETGVGVMFERCSTIALALDADERAELLRRYELLRDVLGVEVELLDAPACRELAPGLSPRVLAGLRVGDCAHLDPRRLVEALGVSARAAGAELVEGRVAHVEPIEQAGVRLLLDDGRTVRASCAVICAGAWSGEIGGVPSRLPVRPVRGQILRLRSGAFSRDILHCGGTYMFGRDDGEVVLGASAEERGFDASTIAGETFRLLEEGIRVVPELREYAVTEVRAGIRPGTPDNRPFVGELAPGVFAAAGHYRTGILLTFATAEALRAALAGEIPVSGLNLLAPDRERFAHAGV
ncbi:MAG: FAD-dependent oxidoreductase [Actinobacteria bacterium]|nr:FAD-dependent oxidoreductase [Actinomycetota bacterium]